MPHLHCAATATRKYDKDNNTPAHEFHFAISGKTGVFHIVQPFPVLVVQCIIPFVIGLPNRASCPEKHDNREPLLVKS